MMDQSGQQNTVSAVLTLIIAGVVLVIGVYIFSDISSIFEETVSFSRETANATFSLMVPLLLGRRYASNPLAKIFKKERKSE